MGQPLDPKKASFYGQLVKAAYTMFQSPQGGDPLRPEPAGVPQGWELGHGSTCSQLPIDSLRPVNTLDLVPKLPPHTPAPLAYEHPETISFSSSA